MDGLLIETSNQLYGISNYFPEEHSRKLKSPTGGVTTHIASLSRNAADVPRLERALMRVAGDSDLMNGTAKPLSNVPAEYSRGRFVVDAAGSPSGLKNQLASKIQQQIDLDKEMTQRQQHAAAERKEARRARREARRQAREEEARLRESLRPSNPLLTREGWSVPTKSPLAHQRVVGDYTTAQAEIGAGVIGTLAAQARSPLRVPVQPAELQEWSSPHRSPILRAGGSTVASPHLHPTPTHEGTQQLMMTSGQLTAELLVRRSRQQQQQQSPGRTLEEDVWLPRMNRTSSLVKNHIEAEHPLERPTEAFVPGSLLRASSDAVMLRSMDMLSPSGLSLEELQRRTLPPGVPFLGASTLHPSGASPKRTVQGKLVTTGDLPAGSLLPSDPLRSQASPAHALTDAARNYATAKPTIAVSSHPPLPETTLNGTLTKSAASSYAPLPAPHPAYAASTCSTRSTARSSKVRKSALAGGTVDRAIGEYRPPPMASIVGSGVGGARGAERLMEAYRDDKRGCVQTALRDKFGAGQELWKGANLHSKQQTSPDNMLLQRGGAGLINGGAVPLRK